MNARKAEGMDYIMQDIINAVSECRTSVSLDGIEMVIESYSGNGLVNLRQVNGSKRLENVRFDDFIKGNFIVHNTAGVPSGCKTAKGRSGRSFISWHEHDMKNKAAVPIEIRPSDLDIADGRSYVIKRHPSVPYKFIGIKQHVKYTIAVEQGESLIIRQTFPDGRVLLTKYNSDGMLAGIPSFTSSRGK